MSTSTTAQNLTLTDLREISVDIVRRAMKGAATAAEVVVRDGSEFSTTVRLGEVETLKESGSRAIGVRVFFGKRSASTWSSDFSSTGIDQMVRAALNLARITSEDPFSGIPENEQLGQISTDLDLYYDDVYSLSTEGRIDHARRAEKAAMSADPRIHNSDGGSFDAATGVKVLANSHGFVGSYRRSYCSVAAVPIAQQEGSSMQRDYWFSVARTLSQLESPEDVGREAARRTLRRLGAHKVKTQRVPIIFDPLVAGALLGHIFEAVNGDSIYRSASFLAGKIGEQIAGSNITIVDDGTIVGGFGSSPFDAEGVPTRRSVVIDKGKLNSYLLNTYTAKKLNMQTTGNASRGLAGTPGIGAGNFFMEPGQRDPKAMLADVKDGFYVTEFLGFGVNLVTGDFSRGASGVWISNGELTFPVEEVTVAGNLKDMLNNISEIGNDLEFRGSVACPTLRIDGMTVAGE
ncbi:MAG TPA: metallopeptidase TldD-related protein [Candidatus Koribacter sp.]|jgi:PmbA protein